MKNKEAEVTEEAINEMANAILTFEEKARKEVLKAINYGDEERRVSPQEVTGVSLALIGVAAANTALLLMHGVHGKPEDVIVAAFDELWDGMVQQAGEDVREKIRDVLSKGNNPSNVLH